MPRETRDLDSDVRCAVASGDALEEVIGNHLQNQLANADRLATLGQLAASVAHEVANPVAFLLVGFANAVELCAAISPGLEQLAELSRSPEAVDPASIARVLEARQMIGAMNQLQATMTDSLDAIRRVGSVAGGLRDFARARDDASEAVDLCEIAGVASRLLQPRIRASARFVQELDAVPPISGSRTKLIQAVTNLLINAAHAVEDAPPGQHEVRVTTSRSGADAVLVVEDTGVGIPPSVAPHVFDPLYTTKRRDRGTGLGLWVVDQVVRAHTGRVSFTSDVGHGTRFELRFPLQVA